MAITKQANYVIEQAVYNALHADEQLAGQEINVRVVEGKAILQGAVNTLAELNHARQIAAGVEQVTQVENNLALPAEEKPGDDAVAAAIERELHRRPALKQPGVEVSVNRGLATLAGAVRTLEQKLEIHEIASRTKGVSRIINLLDIALDDSGERS